MGWEINKTNKLKLKTMSNKTAVHQLMDRLTDLISAIPTKTAHNKTVRATYKHALIMVESIVEKEKHQIMEAHNEGWINGTKFPTENMKHGIDYYNETFK